MRVLSNVLRGSLFLAVAFLGGLVGSLVLRPDAPAAGMLDPAPRSAVVGTFGVGGVVTGQGELWQYRLDKSKWVSLDESFALEGQGTSVVPLPVPVASIRHMETFGFLVTEDGTCWLYNLDEHRWQDIGQPPVRGQGR